MLFHPDGDIVSSISSDRIPIIYAILSAVLFGSCAPMTKYFIGTTEPVMLAALFYCGSGTGMLVLILGRAIIRGGSTAGEAPLTRSDAPYLAGMAIFGGVLAPVTLMYSMMITPAATGSLLLNFEPVATGFFAAFLFHEAVGRRIWIAMGLITGSCLILSLDPAGEFGVSVGSVGVLIACLFWAIDNNISRQVSGRDPLSAILVKGYGAGIISLAIAFFIGESLPRIVDIPVCMVVGFFSFGGLASVFFLLALRSIGTARTGLFLALSPFFGVFFSFLLFAETPQMLFLVAFPVMVLGTWLLVSEKHSHLHYHPPLVHNHRHRHDDLHHDHQHAKNAPPLSRSGEHTHPHSHEAVSHEHQHRPDLHHRHDHRDPCSKEITSRE
ncbi:EamA family transporter [Methanospirillum lacunae]|uniref:EamA family transporter n=1 Tax=Methanospirillum lacunae TaxID=668570 RepID=A0A2V2N4J8_9EURY|nr:EamA family transporter [Methanospirillum lacunae]